MATATVINTGFKDWDRELIAELQSGALNERIGNRILSENADHRVWHIELAPGERLPFHRHRRDYLWLVLTDGSAISHRHDGSTSTIQYNKGDNRRLLIQKPEEEFTHDLINTGDGLLAFITVEFF